MGHKKQQLIPLNYEPERKDFPEDKIFVLHVDDNELFLQLTKKYVENIGEGSIQIDSLINSELAITQLKEKDYDILISDYQMKPFNGLQLLQQVQNHELTVPFVMFTGRGREEVAIQALNLGAKYYIKKGGDIESQYRELVHIIFSVVQARRNEIRLGESENRYHRLFEESPVALWEEDFSEVKKYIDELFKSGITDIREYFRQNRDALMKCVKKINVLDINTTALKIHQTSNKELIIGSLEKTYVDDMYEGLFEEIVGLAEGKTINDGESISETTLGEKFYYYFKSSIVPGYEDSWAKVFVSILDITKRKKIEEQLKSQKNELHMFAHTMAHDLRNTLTSIEGYASLLEKEYERQYANEIRSLVKKTMMILNRSVVLAEAGQVIDQKEPVNLNNIVQEAAKLTLKNNTRFVADPLPIVLGDKVKLFQMFKNLLENAHIHGKADCVEIKVEFNTSEQKYLINIINNGIPILDNIRKEIQTTGRTKGLGMSIINKVVQAHGWHIRLEPIIQPTVFSIIIPKIEITS